MATVKEVRDLNLAGVHDVEIARRLGISQYIAWKTRKNLGLPPVRKNYTVWDAKTDELIVSGTQEQCAEWLGITPKSFRELASRSKKGICKKYVSGGVGPQGGILE